MVVFTLKGEGPTLGGMINHHLFENGASFAACVVPHPEANCLDIHVETETGGGEEECLRASLSDASKVVERMLSDVSVHRIDQKNSGVET